MNTPGENGLAPRRLVRRSWSWAILPAFLWTAGVHSQGEGAAPPAPHQIPLSNVPWKGDLEAMLDRRVIRVLVPYSRTLFFSDRGHERGITADLVRELERYLNTKHSKRLGKRPVTVILVPTTRDKLLSGSRRASATSRPAT